VDTIVLAGPASPRDIAGRITGADAERARTIRGYRGVPVTALAEALLDRGFRVEIISLAPDVDEDVELQGRSLRFLVTPLRAPRARALDLFRDERRRLSQLLLKTEGRVVHAHWTYEFAWAARTLRRPVLVTAHDAPLTVLRFHQDAYRAMRLLMAWCARLGLRDLTAVSPYLASRWRREMLYSRPIKVIPNIAPFDRTEPARQRPGDGRKRIVSVTDVGRRKNVRALLQAFALIRADHPDAELVLVGGGLAAAAERAGFADFERMRFLGHLERDGVRAALASASVFVHPSLEECCPMAVLEAMAAEVPVVAGEQAGGTPWLLQGGAGALVDVKNPCAIAGAVSRILESPTRAEELVRRASARVAQDFSPDAVTAAYSSEYDRVARRPSGS
jgi:L-malate glycosyltransferase